MPGDTACDTSNLSEEERVKIRNEVRFAMVVAQEARSTEKPKSSIEKLFSYLSNGFVLLLVGSLITSVLVPEFQRKYDSRKQQLSLMQECLAQFLLYSNSLWQEYYAVLPLTQKTEIDEKEYLQYVNKVAEIKLKRYDAYAKVLALSVVFNDKAITPSTISLASTIKGYAINLNSASTSIDTWLTGLYCTPTEREYSPCENFDPSFDAYNEHLKIKQFVVNLGNKETDAVAAMIVRQINRL